MPFDTNAFIEQMKGGFGKQAEAQTADVEAEGKQQDLEFKQQEHQLSLLQKLAQIFEIGKKKKADGTESDEPNPIIDMLRKQVSPDTSPITGTSMPQEYAPEVSQDPYAMNETMNDMNAAPAPMSGGYQAPNIPVGSETNMNDMIGGIANGADAGTGMAQNDFMDSGMLEQYLQRYLRGEK